MSPRLLRPIASGIHPEAAAWGAAVVANGGSVGVSLKAVSDFCRRIDAAGLRDRFARLSLVCGSGLNAALVPLYRGFSRTGTQYGNTVDQSLGSPSFGEGDYNETGASGGLLGNGSSKYLDTGLATEDYGADTNSGHISAYHSTPTGTNANRAFLASTGPSSFRRFQLVSDIFSSSSITAQYGGSGNNANATGIGSQVGAPAGHRILSRESATSLLHYLDASLVVSGSGDNLATSDVISTNFYVHARNANGSAEAFNDGRILAYSIGLGMTAQQVTDFYNAMQAFQTALGREL